MRLRPGTAGEVLGIEARTIAQRALVGDAALTTIPEIQALCLSVPNVDALVERLTDFVAGRMHGISVDPSTESMINMLHVTGGRLPVGDIGRLHGVDVRTVQRRIVSATGLTPKQMAMIVQFHRALRLRFYDRLDIVSTAIEAGYADQAHMSRVFRHMGGFSPARLPDLVLAGFPI
ncbi:MAG: helix-turn-helix transcriptional regulator [Acetobacter sp.]|nr:helix-turn-helix transcriptional regulator [Acetobacter sp.]